MHSKNCLNLRNLVKITYQNIILCAVFGGRYDGVEIVLIAENDAHDCERISPG